MRKERLQAGEKKQAKTDFSVDLPACLWHYQAVGWESPAENTLEDINMLRNILLALALVFALCSPACCDELDSVLDTSASGGSCSGGTCRLPSGN